jgi:DNA-binding LacI/PurR family transcriptional regulator
MSELRRHLEDKRYQLQVHTHPLHVRKPDTTIEKVLHHTRAGCWVLIACNQGVQRWFVEHRKPSLIAGHCYEGIRLPSLDYDSEAVVRHAVGTFLHHGHRRIAMVTPQAVLAGQFATERVFREAFRGTPHADAFPIIAHHDWHVPGIRRTVDELLASDRAPTGLLVTYARHALTVLTHLLHSGRHLPEELSLIATDDDAYFPDLVPTLTHYKFEKHLHARRLARLAIQLAETGSLPPLPIRIMPHFQRGETLGPPPS